jgi:hypothetical protein
MEYPTLQPEAASRAAAAAKLKSSSSFCPPTLPMCQKDALRQQKIAPDMVLSPEARGHWRALLKVAGAPAECPPGLALCQEDTKRRQDASQIKAKLLVDKALKVSFYFSTLSFVAVVKYAFL